MLQHEIERLLSLCARLFDLPPATKASLDASGSLLARGYGSLERGRHSCTPEDGQRDAKESFTLGMDRAAGDARPPSPMHGPNQWPPEHLLPGGAAPTAGAALQRASAASAALQLSYGAALNRKAQYLCPSNVAISPGHPSRRLARGHRVLHRLPALRGAPAHAWPGAGAPAARGLLHIQGHGPRGPGGCWSTHAAAVRQLVKVRTLATTNPAALPVPLPAGHHCNERWLQQASARLWRSHGLRPADICRPGRAGHRGAAARRQLARGAHGAGGAAGQPGGPPALLDGRRVQVRRGGGGGGVRKVCKQLGLLS